MRAPTSSPPPASPQVGILETILADLRAAENSRLSAPSPEFPESDRCFPVHNLWANERRRARAIRVLDRLNEARWAERGPAWAEADLSRKAALGHASERLQKAVALYKAHNAQGLRDLAEEVRREWHLFDRAKREEPVSNLLFTLTACALRGAWSLIERMGDARLGNGDRLGVPLSVAWRGDTVFDRDPRQARRLAAATAVNVSIGRRLSARCSSRFRVVSRRRTPRPRARRCAARRAAGSRSGQDPGPDEPPGEQPASHHRRADHRDHVDRPLAALEVVA